jgi:hypothetical protein
LGARSALTGIENHADDVVEESDRDRDLVRIAARVEGITPLFLFF